MRFSIVLLSLGCLPPLPEMTGTETESDSAEVDSGQSAIDTNDLSFELLENGGFEDRFNDADGTERPQAWEDYPSNRVHWGSITNGTPLPDGTFQALGGEAALFIRGADTGTENETAIYQSFQPADGGRFTFMGFAYMARGDAIVDEHTYAILQIKMFNENWELVHNFDSEPIDMDIEPNHWMSIGTSGDTSESVVHVQAAIQFWQCVGQTDSCKGGTGKVFFDDLSFQRIAP